MIKKSQLIGNLLFALVAMIWGTAFAFQRVGMDRIEPITFVASRMTLSAIAVGLVALLQKDGKPSKASTRDTVLGGLGCGFFLTFASISQQMGIVHTTAGKAGFITALYVLIVPVISFVIFKKRYSWIVWVAVLFGVVGMYLLCMTEGFSLSHGDALVCVCAVLFSGHILCCDHFGERGNPIRMSAIQLLVASCVSWIIALLTESPSMDKILSAVVPILYCGILSGGVGYTLQIVAQRYTEAAVASLLMSFESVFAVIAGALILHERMTAREMVGCIVMFAAIVIVQIPMARKKAEPELDEPK